jgi:hypothetical protein
MEQPALMKDFFDRNLGLARQYGYNPDKVIRLLQPLYGFKQSGHAWQQRVLKELATLGSYIQ